MCLRASSKAVVSASSASVTERSSAGGQWAAGLPLAELAMRGRIRRLHVEGLRLLKRHVEQSSAKV